MEVTFCEMGKTSQVLRLCHYIELLFRLMFAGNIIVDKGRKENQPGKRDQTTFLSPLKGLKDSTA